MTRKLIRGALAVSFILPAFSLESGDIQFKKTVLDSEFRSEGVAVADVNRDGKLDILAGALWYEAPHWKPHEIAPVEKFKWDGGYSDSFINAADDVNGDGWPDLMVVGFPGAEARWYENPRNAPGHWKKRTLFRSACNETPIYTDLTGDGRGEWVFSYLPEEQMAWFEPPENIDEPFQAHPISVKKAPGASRFAHGLGVGDVNGDGRKDVICTGGWWEAPEDRKTPGWKFHPGKLGPDCANMIALDISGDGDADVISSSAHRKGIWWFQQVPRDGRSMWVQMPTIDDSIIQTHAMVLADMNGDRRPDLVTGKRFWAHNGGDPEARETRDSSPLCWYEFQRRDGVPTWKKHLIAEGVGVGTQFVVQDINGDGLLDVVVANKKGVFSLEQIPGETVSAGEADSRTSRTVRVLIVTGIDYPGHKWKLTTPVLAGAIKKDPRLEVKVVEDPKYLASPDLQKNDVVVLHFMNWEVPDPGIEARANLRRFVENGKGLVLVHFACGAFQEWPEFRNLAGRAWDPKLRAHDPRGPFRVEIKDGDHEITRGLGSFETDDELYTCLAGDRPIHILATARSRVDGKDYPMAFVFQYGGGRVFHCPLGHDVKALGIPEVGELFRRGCAWAGRLPPAAE